MPISIDPPPGENEIECARCGARFYYDLTRCPACGVNLYEPDDEFESGAPAPPSKRARKRGILDKVSSALHRLTRKPYRAEDVFGDALSQAGVYNDLLGKVGGDRAVVERLVEYERRLDPQGTRLAWLLSAVRRWEKDNQPPG